MTATTAGAETSPVRTVRFGRRSARGVLLGLSAPRLIALGIAFTVALPAVYMGGVVGLLWVSPLWGLAVAAAYVTVAGRHVATWLPVAGHWSLRRARGQNVYGVRVLKPRPAGTLALPGDAAALRVHHDTETGAAMIHDPHASTLTAVARVSHPSFVLLGPADQERRVAGWGRVYATCCASGRVSRIQVLERTLPDSGQGVQRHWNEHGVKDGTWCAEAYEQLVEAAGPTSERHETTIAISLDLTRARRVIRHEGGGLASAAAVLRQELGTVVAAGH